MQGGRETQAVRAKVVPEEGISGHRWDLGSNDRCGTKDQALPPICQGGGRRWRHQRRGWREKTGGLLLCLPPRLHLSLEALKTTNYTPLSCQLQNLPWNRSSRGVAHNDLPARMTPPNMTPHLPSSSRRVYILTKYLEAL